MTSVTFASNTVNSRKRKSPPTVSFGPDFDPFDHAFKFMATRPLMKEYVLHRLSSTTPTLDKLIFCMNAFIQYKINNPMFKGCELYSTAKLKEFVAEMTMYAKTNSCGGMLMRINVVQKEENHSEELVEKIKKKCNAALNAKVDEGTFAGSLFQGANTDEVSQGESEKKGSEQLEEALWNEIQTYLDKWDEV